METLAHSLEEEILAAFMTGIPLLLVEGPKDMQIYCEICKMIPKRCNIQAIELVESNRAGCFHLIDLISAVDPYVMRRLELKDHYLGILDCDARWYRNEVPAHNSILVLKYYSIESHFITELHMRNFIQIATNYPKDLSSQTATVLWGKLFINLQHLYYSSLEALRNACESDYDAAIGYADSYGKATKDPVVQSLILSKKCELDAFAISRGITFSLQSVLRISKGKWAIRYFAERMKSILTKLAEYCNSGEIEQCDYCAKGIEHKCLYRNNATFSIAVIESLMTSFMSESELEYIIERIRKLA